MKRCSTSYVLREMQVKSTMTYHFMPVRTAKIQNTDSTKCWQACGATGTLFRSWWEWKWCRHFGRHFGDVHTKCPHHFGDVHMDVYSSFIQNCQNLETTKMFFSRWMDKQTGPPSVYHSKLKRNELSAMKRHGENLNACY